MKALLVIDVQNDFCPGGALAVKDGDEIIPVINNLIPQYDLVVTTQDWHPVGHKSFASVHNRPVGDVIDLNGIDQVLWPDHCVQNSLGADFAPGLNIGAFRKIIQKGTHINIDSYSGFFDNDHKHATGLHAYLQEQLVTEVHIVGLATDYCVMYTALDAQELGYKTAVILDACRGVELKDGDIHKAVENMKANHIQILNLDFDA